MTWAAFATFVHHDGRVFRTRTELRRPGGRGDPLGAVVMINPGSSRPLGEYGQMALASVDNTMRAVISVVEDACRQAGRPLPATGHLAIHNLFNLCEQDLFAAIATLKKGGWGRDHPMHASQRLPRSVPWVWCAWGAEKAALRPLMLDWLDRLEGLPRVGVPIPSGGPGYYHPAYLKRMRVQRPALREEIVGQIAARVRNLA